MSDWEIVIGVNPNKAFHSVRRLWTPSGWLYQVQTTRFNNIQMIEWSNPVFVPFPPQTEPRQA